MSLAVQKGGPPATGVVSPAVQKGAPPPNERAINLPWQENTFGVPALECLRRDPALESYRG